MTIINNSLHVYSEREKVGRKTYKMFNGEIKVPRKNLMLKSLLMLKEIRRLTSLRRGLMVFTGIKGICALDKTLSNLASKL